MINPLHIVLVFRFPFHHTSELLRRPYQIKLESEIDFYFTITCVILSKVIGFGEES